MPSTGGYARFISLQVQIAKFSFWTTIYLTSFFKNMIYEMYFVLLISW
jgi:hypothetical protein